MEFRDKMKAPITGSTSGLGLLDISNIFPENFPEGLRVLVVDDDATCLLVAKNLLEQCKYKVTTCLRATLALSLLRERRDYFDLVLTDVHMPDMSGIELLERVGIEMDLPVIMMSADSRPSTIIEGIKHGACDYLVKPVRIEELQIIWQHVVRRKFKEYEHSGSLEDSDLSKRVSDGAEYQCSVNDGKDSTSKYYKRKRAEKEDNADDGLVNQHPSSSKKRRVVWTVKLHQEFLEAVNKLGVDKAVPKKILEFMPSSNLTREHVASHLQKYRLYLRKASGVNRQENASHTSFCGSGEQNLNAQSHGRHLFQNLAVSGRIPPQTWPAMNAELSGHLPGSDMLPTMNQPALFQSPMPDHMNNPPQQLTYCQQPSSGQINVSQQFHHSNLPVQNMSSGLPNWSSYKFGAVSSAGNLEGMNHAVNVQTHCAVNIQPSWLGAQSNPQTSFHIGGNPVPMNQTSMVVPSQSLFSFQAGNTSIAISQGNNNISTDSVHDLLPSMPNNVPYGMAQIRDVGTKNVSVPPGTSNGILFDQGQRRNLGFVGEGTCILSQFAAGDAESPIPNPENSNMWGTLLEEFSPSDFIDDLSI